ncbi:MAG: hypothetical protein MUE94_02080 [Verrucomicrobia bacterium]|jgi:O-antigen/teichoic acid export membrane protein|nr:hypothetical protein [Verrucomicrobiota bacterium]
MANLAAFAKRVRHSAVAWSWVFNFLRLAGGLLLLPLLLTRLSEADLGMYYVFLRLVALVPIFDFGFSVSIGRHVSYAVGGARSIQAIGLTAETAGDTPNYPLLWQLLVASRRLYSLMALAAFVLLGAWGTWNVMATVDQTDDPSLTWLAWGIALAAATFELYLGWWNAFLRGANQVVAASRYAVTGYAVQLGVAVGLLLCGGGLLSLPIGTLAGGLLIRLLSRRACLRLLGNHISSPAGGEWQLIRALWPNSWRAGLQFLSSYIGVTVPGLLFASQYGLETFAPYGVSNQVMTICMGMALVWMQVKWPQVGQYRARGDLVAMRRLLRPRFWFQNLTFVSLAVCAIALGPTLLGWIGSGKQLLPSDLLGLLALVFLLDLQFTFWTTLISTENRIPSLWPTVATQILALGLYLLFSLVFNMGYLALILPPLAAGGLFNYWYWMFRGARSMGTNLVAFLLHRD